MFSDSVVYYVFVNFSVFDHPFNPWFFYVDFCDVTPEDISILITYRLSSYYPNCSCSSVYDNNKFRFYPYGRLNSPKVVYFEFEFTYTVHPLTR